MLPEDYEEMRNLFANSSSEKEKPLMLRSEARRYLSTITGYAEMMSILIKERGASQLPDDFGEWCEIILTKSRTLSDLIDTAAGIERNEP